MVPLLLLVFVVFSALATCLQYVFNLGFDANRSDNCITHYFCVHQHSKAVKPTMNTFHKTFNIRHVPA